jgi:hypothetical protein
MSDVERTSAGLQLVIPGCERRTLPKSTSRVALTRQAKGYFTSTNHRACESSLRRARITSRPVLGLAGIGQIRDGVGGGNGPPGTYPLFPQGVSHKPEN